VWHVRHLISLEKEERGEIAPMNPDIREQAEAAAQRIVTRYGPENVGPWDDWHWGFVNGQLATLRWVLGTDWDEPGLRCPRSSVFRVQLTQTCRFVVHADLRKPDRSVSSRAFARRGSLIVRASRWRCQPQCVRVDPCRVDDHCRPELESWYWSGRCCWRVGPR
jgi:hypothetical protein